MNRTAVAAMVRRRGNLIAWEHAVPPDPATLNPLTGGPTLSLGATQAANVGNFGETFLPAVNVWAYFSQRTTSVDEQGYGMVDVGNAQLDFPVPYVQANGSSALVDPDPSANPPIVGTTPSLSDYNSGRFARVLAQEVYAQNGAQPPIAFDRFVINGTTWTAKAEAVPLTDQNVVVAWRVLIVRVSV